MNRRVIIRLRKKLVRSGEGDVCHTPDTDGGNVKVMSVFVKVSARFLRGSKREGELRRDVTKGASPYMFMASASPTYPPKLNMVSIERRGKPNTESIWRRRVHLGTTGLPVVCSVLLCLFWVSNASAFWIWTPETKRWINPKYSPQENARLQLEEVKKHYDSDNYAIALREARKLVSYFPRAREAAEGQFYIGLCLEKLDKYYPAYKAYQKAIKKYPFSEKIIEMIRRQYEIGNLFLEGKIRQTFGSFLSGDEPAIEIFNTVLENSPYSEFASASQYKLGLALLNTKRLYEAREAFEKVLDDYPNSAWAESAKYQIAVVTAKVSGGFAYDAENTVSARKQFEDLITSYPDAQFSREAKQKVSSLREEEAEGNFQIGKFYEKQKALESARIYYQYVVDNYPESMWAKSAKEQLLSMENKE